MRFMISAVCALLAAACAPQTSAPTDELAALAPCGDDSVSGALTASACTLEAGGQTLRVQFAALAAGASFGMITIDVLDENGAITQTLTEADVSQYQLPQIEDVDGDGRADILIPREFFNANTTTGVWIYRGDRGVFERVGQFNGVGFERTPDGYIGVPARSSAVAWDVTFYSIADDGLHELVSVQVTAPSGRATEPSCALTITPGLRELGLTELQARRKFCAEHVAQVFEP